MTLRTAERTGRAARATAQATPDGAVPRSAGGRPGSRPAQRVRHLAGLGLDELRAYRQELMTEESRVSYWRRILQARIDTATDPRGERATPAHLRDVLSRQQEASRRLAVLPVHDAVGLPPIPDLEALWDSGPEADDASLVTRLADAEAELSTYRRGLHERLDDATSELISRYREEPSLALRALPLGRRAG